MYKKLPRQRLTAPPVLIKVKEQLTNVLHALKLHKNALELMCDIYSKENIQKTSGQGLHKQLKNINPFRS